MNRYKIVFECFSIITSNEILDNQMFNLIRELDIDGEMSDDDIDNLWYIFLSKFDYAGYSKDLMNLCTNWIVAQLHSEVVVTDIKFVNDSLEFTTDNPLLDVSNNDAEPMDITDKVIAHLDLESINDFCEYLSDYLYEQDWYYGLFNKHLPKSLQDKLINN